MNNYKIACSIANKLKSITEDISDNGNEITLITINHLIICGPGSNYIKNELKNTYNARWQPTPFNFWLIPNTKKKIFIKDKNIITKVNIVVKEKSNVKKVKEEKEFKEKSNVKKVKEEKEFKEESIIEELNDNLKTQGLDILPKDIIRVIINEIDNKTLTSLLTTTKQLST